MTNVKVGEYLLLNTSDETWRCSKCGKSLGSARRNYKEGCLVNERDPSEIYAPQIEGKYSFSPDPNWCRLLEFYCPSCGTLIETEVLPPGHPISHDIEIDVDKLKSVKTA